MTRQRLVWVVVLVCFVCFTFIVGTVVLLRPIQGRFTVSEYMRVKSGMTFEEVEATLGPAIPVGKSLMTPSSEAHVSGWRVWGDGIDELHVGFDAGGRVYQWTLHPVRPRVIDHLRARFNQ